MTAQLSDEAHAEMMKHSYEEYDKCFLILVELYSKLILNAEYISIEESKRKAEIIALRLLGPKDRYK